MRAAVSYMVSIKAQILLSPTSPAASLPIIVSLWQPGSSCDKSHGHRAHVGSAGVLATVCIYVTFYRGFTSPSTLMLWSCGDPGVGKCSLFSLILLLPELGLHIPHSNVFKRRRTRVHFLSYGHSLWVFNLSLKWKSVLQLGNNSLMGSVWFLPSGSTKSLTFVGTGNSDDLFNTLVSPQLDILLSKTWKALAQFLKKFLSYIRDPAAPVCRVD